jgi:transposase
LTTSSFFYKAPQLNPYPGKKSVVILDNCSIHHDEELREIIVEECGEFGCSLDLFKLKCTPMEGACLVYLPPYSPDFNPIEEAFSTIKAWLRRNEHRYAGAEDMPWLIHQAAACISADDALAWFGDCGYL